MDRLLRRPQQTSGAPSRPGSSNVMMIVIAGIVLAIIIAINAGYDPWNALFINPLINFLILFNNIFFHNFGIAIILFTIFMRMVTMPLTIRQFQSTRALSAIQPRMQEIQKKYKDPKRRQEETMKLYQEAGINPLGCLVPMVIQFPIWIALYRALRIMVGGTPESLVQLSQRLYPWSYLRGSVPLEQHFLWLNLGHPDTTFVLPVFVGVTTYLQQKMTTTTPTTPEQRQQQQMMNWMMPLFFVWITLAVPSGLGLYWFVSNVTAVMVGYMVMGRRIDWRQLSPFAVPAPAPAARAPRPERESQPRREREAEIVDDSGIESEATPLEAERKTHARRRRGKRKNR
ncbi:MAG TPA: YidC/Oxa1 family membrane protein insertase [Dehalococcoidia bacterium]|nr:YidC/Oxa1 family membrane protein insertase [Dehalococcoidia bacterium]